MKSLNLSYGTRERFFKHVRRTTGCWYWLGHKTFYGYGHFRIGDKTLRAHRVSWMLHHGPIPEGMCICHHCDKRFCVNLDHLFCGTQEDNMQDAVLKGRAPGQRLKPNDYAQIVARARTGERYFKIAADFGISSEYVRKLRG